jgi:hypothetical protein
MNSRFGPPIDLSDLLALQPADQRPRRSAFVGRVSTKDNQDPTLSIPRQVALASERLEEGEEFVAFYWDVESGMLPPEQRGLGPREMYDALAVTVPRDGGLQDLLERTKALEITHVLAERSDRVARHMLTSLTVEHELERLGVEVVYANEPIGGTESGRLRTRRYGQVDAEVYRATMLEMSMGGQFQHAAQGYNHGIPPYPYIAVVDEGAPSRPRGRFGEQRPKRKLAPHPDTRRFVTAAEMCRLRREEHLKPADIIAILSAAPRKYPLVGHRWTHNHVEGLIANPKLAGYQVYNRKASRTGRPGASRWNPVSKWVWSPGPVHEAVISLQEWKEAQLVTASLHARAGGALAQIRTEALRLGLAFTEVEVNRTGSHTLYRIGERKVALPTPVPDTIVQQIIEDMRNASAV